nr:hypothetical protein [Tanacetum cinerariifolium]
VSLFMCKDGTSCLQLQYFNRNSSGNIARSW